jgi:hypothetical protein
VEEFEEAADEYDVPASLLLAMGYVTRDGRCLRQRRALTSQGIPKAGGRTGLCNSSGTTTRIPWERRRG